MNFLPLLLIGLFLGGEKLTSLKELLCKIDFASFTPIFQLIGLDNKTVDFLCSEDFSDILSSSSDLKALLPLLTSLLAKPKTESDKTEDNQKENLKPCDYLAPIKNVAPTDVGATIENYFN